MLKTFYNIPLIVHVVIKNYVLVVFFQLFIKCLHIADFLAGGGVDFVGWVVLANVFFQNRGKYKHFIFAIIACFHAEIAEFIVKILFFYERIGECESDRNTLCVDTADNVSDEIGVALIIGN